MNKVFGCLVIVSFLLTGCGGGTPYVGLWQCANNPDQSLEIKRFEEYFIITARNGAQQIKREGLFENEMFTAGANNVGAPMTLELNGEEITCTKPPNFCHCDSPYEKVDSLAHAEKTKTRSQEQQTVEPKVTEQDTWIDEQIILDREPIVLELRNGGTVRVFHHAANEVNEKLAHDWNKLKYHYLPQLALAKLDDGTFAEVRENGDEVSVFFRITVSKIDKFDLMENIHKSSNHTRIQPNLVIPLSYEQITVEILDSSSITPAVISSSEIDLKRGPLDVTLSVNGTAGKLKAASEIVAAINNGSTLPVASIEIMQKITTANTGELGGEQVPIKWPIVGQSKRL